MYYNLFNKIKYINIKYDFYTRYFLFSSGPVVVKH